jgi:GDPmannose 4,6-dehydratase
VDEVGIDPRSGKVLVKIDPRYFRPAEVEFLWGDPSKANQKLGWRSSTELRDLCRMMVRYDLNNDGYGGQDT